jgi:DnaK suppressor protein
VNESEIGDILRRERSATLLRIRAMQSDLDAIVAASEDANVDDEHDPEGSTIAYERAQVASLMVGAQSNLDDLDQALGRLSAGRYSVCEQCQGQIPAERLEARPAARTCIGCASTGH